ncbi:type II toxin-antitoxin system PemK/MazF family toxin [Gemmatimonas sp.]|uniref:type II toxin-antitoxin system PemK/MazF family toxin n=1 Tax=Gemmatimonas sp. TaxID=1962908 RepID=UPI003DA6BF19
MVSVGQVRRGDVYLVNLDPTVGREIRKARPCVVVSPDELNAHLATFIVAPLTTGAHAYPFRVACRFDGKDGHVVLDQLRTVDRVRLSRRLGALTAVTQGKVLTVLREMFAV